MFINEDALTLEDCELQYAALDVYSRMLKRAGEKDETMVEKLALCEKINTILLETKQEYLKKCKYCGFPLPPDFKFNVCDRCFRRGLRRGFEPSSAKPPLPAGFGSKGSGSGSGADSRGSGSSGSRKKSGGRRHDREMGFKVEWFDPE